MKKKFSLVAIVLLLVMLVAAIVAPMTAPPEAAPAAAYEIETVAAASTASVTAKAFPWEVAAAIVCPLGLGALVAVKVIKHRREDLSTGLRALYNRQRAALWPKLQPGRGTKFPIPIGA